MKGLIALKYELIFLLITGENYGFCGLVAMIYIGSLPMSLKSFRLTFFRYSPLVLSDCNVFASYFNDRLNIYFFGDTFKIVFRITCPLSAQTLLILEEIGLSLWKTSLRILRSDFLPLKRFN